MIQLRMTNGKTWTELKNLKVWEKNPRSIETEDFERLKRQLSDLGQYKPLLVTEDGEVVGGNMRFRAYKDLGVNEVWVSILAFADVSEKPGNVSVLIDGKFQKIGDNSVREFISREQAMLEYAISDNDTAGRTNSQALAELTHPYREVVPMENYKIEVYEGQPLAELVESISNPKDEVRQDSTGEIVAEDTVVIAIKFTKEEYANIEPDLSQFMDVNEAQGYPDMLKKILNYWRQTKDMPVVETPADNIVDNSVDNGDNSAPIVDNTDEVISVAPGDIVGGEGSGTSEAPGANGGQMTSENPIDPSIAPLSTPEVIEPVVEPTTDSTPQGETSMPDASMPPTTDPVVNTVTEEVVETPVVTPETAVTTETPVVAPEIATQPASVEDSLTVDELFAKAREASIAGNNIESERLANLARSKESAS